MKKYLAAISAIVIAASSFGFSALNVSAADSTVDASIGTDSADDTSALQRAINQGEGGTVNIPAGTYYINGPLRVKSNTHIILDDGARIVRTDDSQYMLSYAGVDSTSSGYDKLSNVTIEGGVWDGNPTNTSTNAKGLVLIRNANNITLKNTTFQNCCGTHFLLFEGVSDITMTDCTVKNFIPFTGSESAYKTATKAADFRYRTTEAVHIDYINGTQCKNVTIQNNYFENLTTAIGTHAHASDTGSENYSVGIDVENNTFQNCSFYGLDAAYFTDFIFSWNTLTDCGGMVYAQHSTGTISDNSLTSASPAIYTYLDEIPTDGVHAKMNSSLTIINNSMNSVNGYAIRAKENSTIKYADNSGVSSTKDDGTVTFKKIKPEQVQTTTYTATTDAIRINWNAIDGADGYRIYCYQNGKWKSIKTLGKGNITTYRISGLEAGTVYKYKVKAFIRDESGQPVWGLASEEFITAADPEKPVIVKVGRAKTAVRLYWNKIECSGYKIQQYDNSTKSWKTIKLASADKDNYRVNGLKSGKSYKFRIQAYTRAGSVKSYSKWSSTKSTSTKK